MYGMGTAKIDITPDRPVPLAGYAVRGDKPFESVAEPIYLRIARLRQTDGAADGGTSSDALIVSGDLLWWGSERVQQLKERIRDRFGIRENHVLLHATHSHSGPQLSTAFHPLLGSPDAAYIRYVEDRLIAGIEEASRSMTEVRMEQGTGSCPIGINRRLPLHGKIELQDNPDGVVDHEVRIVRFVTVSGQVKALFVHYACHPVLSMANELSSEFTGVAMEMLERDLAASAGGSDTAEPMALFLQGACGDINPTRPGQAGTPNEIVHQVAEQFTESLRAVLAGPFVPLKEGPIRGDVLRLPLPFAELPAAEQLTEWAATGDSAVRTWAEWFLHDPARLQRIPVLEMTHLRLAGDWSLVTFNAEMVVFYGYLVKRLSAGTAWPVAYTNGMIGYVTTAEQVAEGGYEALGSTTYFLLPSSFAPSHEAAIASVLAGLLEG